MPETSQVRTRRIFMHNGTRLADPDPTKTPQEVKAILAASYPDLTTATMSLNKTEDGPNGTKTETWEFRRSVGTKG